MYIYYVNVNILYMHVYIYIYKGYIYVCILCPQIMWMISQYCSTVNEQHLIKKDQNSFISKEK